jgi:hypothetical protein
MRPVLLRWKSWEVCLDCKPAASEDRWPKLVLVAIGVMVEVANHEWCLIPLVHTYPGKGPVVMALEPDPKNQIFARVPAFGSRGTKLP